MEPPPSLNYTRLVLGYEKVLEALDKSVTTNVFAASLKGMSASKAANIRAQFLSQWKANAKERFSTAVRRNALQPKMNEIDALLRSWPASSRTEDYRAPVALRSPSDQVKGLVHQRRLARIRDLEVLETELRAQVAAQRAKAEAARNVAKRAMERVVEMSKRTRLLVNAADQDEAVNS